MSKFFYPTPKQYSEHNVFKVHATLADRIARKKKKEADDVPETPRKKKKKKKKKKKRNQESPTKIDDVPDIPVTPEPKARISKSRSKRDADKHGRPPEPPRKKRMFIANPKSIERYVAYIDSLVFNFICLAYVYLLSTIMVSLW